MRCDLIMGVCLSGSPYQWDNSYVYMKDVLALDSCRPIDTTEFVRHWEARSPLNQSERAALLTNHPDRSIVEYILRGIQESFHIGFNRKQPNK